MNDLEIESKGKSYGLDRLQKLNELEKSGKPRFLQVTSEETENIILLSKLKFSVESIETIYCLTITPETIRDIIANRNK